jgi:hypothetical protein
MRAVACLLGLGALVLALPVRAQDRPVTSHPARDREQQLEREVKTERDRPQKKERARAAAGRVEDGVRDFGRGLQGVMKEAGISDGPPPAKSAAKAAKGGPPAKTARPADKPAAGPTKSPAKSPPVPAAKPAVTPPAK